jgi:hypothetical protein
MRGRAATGTWNVPGSLLSLYLPSVVPLLRLDCLSLYCPLLSLYGICIVPHCPCLYDSVALDCLLITVFSL